VLARTTLAPNNPVLTDAAYNVLFRAARLLGFQLTNDYEYSHAISTPSSVTEEAFANFVRCLSGAFHSLGGTLYQAGKYGSAIRFLRCGCPLGTVALRLRRSCDLRNLSSAQKQPKTPGSKEAEGWGQLHDQLSRRWELLGVSCSKIGDRQVSQNLSRFPIQSPSLLSPAGGLRSFHRVSWLVCLSTCLRRVGPYDRTHKCL
jgi:separase